MTTQSAACSSSSVSGTDVKRLAAAFRVRVVKTNFRHKRIVITERSRLLRAADR